MTVSGLCNSQLRRTPTGLSPPWAQSEIASDRTAIGEAVGIIQREHVGERNQWPDALDLLQQSCFRVFLFSQAGNLPIIALDLFRQGPNALYQRFHGVLEF